MRRARQTHLTDRESQESSSCKEEGIILGSVSAMVQYLQVRYSFSSLVDILTGGHH